jgi:phage baseplate assembly protein W
MTQRYFVGFSTQNSLKTGVSTLYDIDLINADLMGAFQTRPGERIMRPGYGCKLWDYLMEPMNAGLREKIIKEAIRVCEEGKRLAVLNVDVTESTAQHGFKIDITLAYDDPINIISTFTASFEQSESLYYGNNSSLLEN